MLVGKMVGQITVSQQINVMSCTNFDQFAVSRGHTLRRRGRRKDWGPRVTVSKMPAMTTCLSFALLAFLGLCCGQSIPLIASPSGGQPDAGIDVRYPGPQYVAPSAMRPQQLPPQQGVNPIGNLLGNLLGGLGALAMNLPPPLNSNYPPNPPYMPPPHRFPGSGRLTQSQMQESVIECTAPPTPQLIPRRGQSELGSDFSNKTGFCVPSPMECRGRGGTLLGPCLRFRGTNMPPQIVGACCYYQTTCGGDIHVNGTHFRSPNFPDPYPSPGSCQATVKNTYSNICQLRLDFIVFNLKQPVLGNCNSDRFVVNGQSNNDIIPSLCGYNPDQHSK